MPNWCNNKLRVYGPEAEVDRFRASATGVCPWAKVPAKTHCLNFHSLVPIAPEVLAAGYESAGHEWELIHWGCKWGAVDSQELDAWAGHLEYGFETAWSPPLPFLEQVALAWPALTFLLDYEEPGLGFKGIAKLCGPQVEDHCLDF